MDSKLGSNLLPTLVGSNTHLNNHCTIKKDYLAKSTTLEYIVIMLLLLWFKHLYAVVLWEGMISDQFKDLGEIWTSFTSGVMFDKVVFKVVGFSICK